VTGSTLKRKSILFGFLLVSLIIVFEIILAHLGLPAFMVMIFFVAHEDVSLAPDILIGGLACIVCIFLSKDFIHLLGHPSGLRQPSLPS
jgi:cytochrome c oxidase subunit IV